jgi:hypothetical protein
MEDKSTSEMKAKKKEAKEKAAQAELVLRDEAAAEPAKDAEATAKSTAEMKAEKKKHRPN